ncbi:hypothetical protein MBLNU13_g02284t3 [Cladosporium sp. NU13]
MESSTEGLQHPRVRPYRSHKVPACSACRQRKGRCEVDDPSVPCQYCRRRKLDCDHAVRQQSAQKDRSPPAKRSRKANIAAVANAAPTSAGQQLLGNIQEDDESSPVMVNPSMAEDVDVLEQHLATQNAFNVPERRTYVRLSSANGESIVYRRVARRREGLRQTPTPGLSQLEIIENVLGPSKTEVIKLYGVHQSQIIDETSFWSLWRKDSRRISPTLLCDLYAVTLAYWNCSEKLRGHSRPDIQFIWNQAVLALRDDFMAPSMATIHAALLDMLGRPIYHITGNIVNAGRTVNLAHSQGLHRDPSKWRVSGSEKKLRTKVWWALVIHDHWSSLSHGTPPSISSQNYDVDLPTTEPSPAMATSGSSTHATETFPYLCRLTKLLGELLPIIYSLRANNTEHWKQIRRTECALDDWLDALPDCLNPTKESTNKARKGPGASGLWFCYLSLQLVLNGLAFKVTKKEDDREQKELHIYRLALLLKSASSLVDYVASLQEQHFREFWLPYTAYLLVSATTTLLRLLVESDDASYKAETCSKLLSLLETLKTAREHYDWDLAQLCIDTCGQPIEKLAAVNSSLLNTDREPRPDTMGDGGATPLQDGTEYLDGVQLGAGAVQPVNDSITFPLDLDIPWDYLWEDMIEPWLVETHQDVA